MHFAYYKTSIKVHQIQYVEYSCMNNKTVSHTRLMKYEVSGRFSSHGVETCVSVVKRRLFTVGI